MKRTFSILICLIASSVTLTAEETTYASLPAPWDFLAVKDQKIKSVTAFLGNDYVFWEGEGFHTGLQEVTLTLFSTKEIPEEFDAPISPSIYLKYTDAYGNIEASHERDISDCFMMMKVLDSWEGSIGTGCTVNRGGEYTVEFGLAPGLFKEERQMTIKDEACARVYNTLFKSGEPMSSTLIVTGGYPFDTESIKGEHSLDWTLSPAGTSSSISGEGHETFTLETDKTLIAPVVNFNLDFGSLEPGKYLGSITSDFSPANSTFNVEVRDVLQTDISIEKEHYVIGTDNEVNLKIAMKYGYPYISLNSDTGKRTIRIRTELLGEEHIFDFSEEAWGDSYVDYTADISVPLNDITHDIASQSDWKLPLEIKVIFNGTTQTEKLIEIPLANTSGIESINSDDKSSPKYYNVFGQRVDSSYRGIVISSDGRKILLNAH